MKRLPRTNCSFSHSRLQHKCLVIWLVLGLGASVGGACGDDQGAEPPACINGADCDWIDIEHNDSSTLGCAVRSNGTVWCWGYFQQSNNPGQSVWYRGFDQVIISEEIEDVSIGDDTICALAKSGGVWCWGDGSAGQVGDGTTEFRESPTRVHGIDSAVQLARGCRESCVLLEDRSVWCWGVADRNGSYDLVLTPIPKAGLPEAKQISVGRYHACAIDVGGSLHCWGLNNWGQIGLPLSVEEVSTLALPHELAQPVKVTDVDCGTGHTCAVQDNGTVWCWGANDNHQLGIPVSTDGTHIPGQVATLVDMVEVHVGNNNTCAANLSGSLWCWGGNNFGQVGYAPFDHVYFDIPVPYEHLSDFRSLSLQASFAIYAVTADGTAWGWGRYEDLYVFPPRDDLYDFTWLPVRMYNPVRD